ncbi:hypothetical protein [Nocardioides daejeonensis]|uniref:hypothetical protein n=1 Tax=Nocardioides daejeonensis TaxID=1046556 RepID=UPI000D7497F0|nr:hypothetical protein [Nocardioides daejeonensis]
MNLCFDALDKRVILGEADLPAIRGAVERDHAHLLEEVGAFAGLLRGVGVEAGTPVGVELAEPYAELLVLLATARIGGTLVELRGERLAEHRPHAVVTDRLLDLGGHAPGAVVLRGPEVVDPVRDLPWELAMRAGRSDPAGSVAVEAASIAWITDGPVAVGEALGADDRYAAWLRDFAAGRPVEV